MSVDKCIHNLEANLNLGANGGNEDEWKFWVIGDICNKFVTKRTSGPVSAHLTSSPENVRRRTDDRPRCYKTLLMLNSAEHEICPAHKSLNGNNCWHFNIY